MDPVIQVDERVDVVTIFYGHAQERMVCVPWKMKYRGQEIVFTVFGMRHPTARGRRMIHVFDMSDGSNDYRLEFDAESLTWQLVSRLEGSQYVR
ncbi:hypothetical protein EOL73_04430 [Candidatus Saccharibacteria bacterium]|nr:hypothetical protein [Candidatus Saccharibacteria bacterium]NCU40972.1 hypothetical protein [Candidatus Saccharibacteria bacterium]